MLNSMNSVTSFTESTVIKNNFLIYYNSFKKNVLIEKNLFYFELNNFKIKTK